MWPSADRLGRLGARWRGSAGALREREERRLVDDARAGNPAALAEIRRLHDDAVRGFCAAMLESAEDHVEPAVDETFAAAEAELPRMPRDVRLRAVLLGLAYERCVARLDEQRREHGAVAATDEPHEDDRRRGAVLLGAALAPAELGSLTTFATSRPALFGLIGAVVHRGSAVIARTPAGDLTGEAVAALASSGASEADRSGAADAADVGSATRGLTPARAEWLGRAATVGAIAVSAVVVAGAGAYSLGGGGRDGARQTPVVAPGTGGTSVGGPAGVGTNGDVGSPGRGGRDGRPGARPRTVIRTPRRGDGLPRRGSGRDGRNGGDGRDGARGRDATAPVRDHTRFLPPTDPGGGGRPPGGGDPPRRPLLKLDVQSGDTEAHIEVP